MPRTYRLSRHRPNDADPVFFDSVGDWIDDLWERGIELHFMEERDLGPSAREWRWMTLRGEHLELVVCDDLTVGAREIILEGASSTFGIALPVLEARLSIEPYSEAFGRAAAEPESARALLRACVASPRPPSPELEGLVKRALDSPDSDLRYGAVSAAVTLQAQSMKHELETRAGLEGDPKVLALVQRAIASFG